MKIGILCHPGCGGSTRVAVDLASGLAHGGHEVHLLSQARPFAQRADSPVQLHTPSGRADPWPEADRLHASWSDGELAAFGDLALRVTRHVGLDILHFHYAVPFARIVADLARRIGRRRPRLVGTLHGTDVSIHGRGAPGAQALRRDLAAVDRLTAPSAYQADLATALLGLARRPLRAFDQFGNGARVVFHGLGPRGDRRRDDAGAIRRKALAVLGDDGYRARLRAMRDQVARFESQVDLAAMLREAVAGPRPMRHVGT